MEDLSSKTARDHAQLVARLEKPGAAIIATLTPNSMLILHAAIGISGEAGELLDAIKKWTMYNKPLDRENVIEELGDMEFYLQSLRSALRISREDVLAANISKLEKRYPSGRYSDAQAQARADKVEIKAEDSPAPETPAESNQRDSLSRWTDRFKLGDRVEVDANYSDFQSRFDLHDHNFVLGRGPWIGVVQAIQHDTCITLCFLGWDGGHRGSHSSENPLVDSLNPPHYTRSNCWHFLKYDDQYLRVLKMSRQLRTGDTVRITRKARPEDVDAWADEWVEAMDYCVGEIGTVRMDRLDDDDPNVIVAMRNYDLGVWNFPVGCLELIGSVA